MKKVLLIICIFYSYYLFGIDKPLIKIGYTGNGNFAKSENKDSIYPSLLKDSIFYSIDEPLSEYFSFKHKINFDYTNYNKYSKNINDLTSYNLNNYITLIFNFSNSNQISLSTKPCYYNKFGEKYFYDMNMITYSLKVNNFSLKTYYSNQFALRGKELIYHKLNLSLYWNFPNKEYLKFKMSFSSYFQHGIYEEIQISPIKSFNVNFEIALDFNKIKFEDLFKNNDYTEDFFYD